MNINKFKLLLILISVELIISCQKDNKQSVNKPIRQDYIEAMNSDGKYVNINGFQTITQDKYGNIFLVSDDPYFVRRNGYEWEVIDAVPNFPANCRVFCSIRDSKGDLWFGTTIGLLHYDGSQYEMLTTDNGLLSNVILDIAADSKGNIWLITQAVGITKYDGLNFHQYQPDTNIYVSANYLSIDNYDNIWITIGLGLYKFDGIQWKFFHPTNIFPPNFVFFPVLTDNKNNIWVGSYSGLAEYTGKQWNIYDNTEFQGNWIYDIKQDKTGLIWVAFYGSSSNNYCCLASFDGTNWKYYSKNDGLSCSVVLGIFVDLDNNIWLNACYNIYNIYY